MAESSVKVAAGGEPYEALKPAYKVSTLQRASHRARRVSGGL